MRKTVLSTAAAALLAACAAPPPAPPPPPPPPAPAVAVIDWFAYDGHDAVYDVQKTGPKEYLNPIRQGYYPDPSIVRAGDDYYLVNSTFIHFPGLPVFHSKDLVHWTQVGNAIDRPSQVDFGKLEVSRGLYAPQLSYHDGTFTIINTCVSCGGNFLITAKDPAGPWSDPVWLGFDGIDPSLLFDSDGKVYVVHNDVPDGPPKWDGHRALWMQEYDPAAKKMVGPHKVIVDGGVDIKKKPVWIEGPHLYKINGWYYLMAAEGGTGLQHSEVIFRSKKVWGPYKPAKTNPILTQRDLDPAREFPVTATGHADLVQTQKGDWYAMFLGTRPYGLSTDDFFNTGRQTFLLPVTWKNGWPMILKKGVPVPFVVKRPNLPYDGAPLQNGNFSYREAFDGSKLGPEWVTIRTPKESWWSLKDGSLTLAARKAAIGGFSQPSFIARRQQHADAAVSIALRFDPKIDGERAGLVAFQSDFNFYFLGLVRENGKNAVCVSRRQAKDEPENGVTLGCAPAPEGKLNLKIAVRGGLIDFFYGSEADKWTALLKDADATILSSKKACCFVGTVIGPYAYTP
jgi:alpha-N-arabinofuranosidase